MRSPRHEDKVPVNACMYFLGYTTDGVVVMVVRATLRLFASRKVRIRGAGRVC